MTRATDKPHLQHYCTKHLRQLMSGLVSALSYQIERHLEFDVVGSDLVPQQQCDYVTLSMEGIESRCTDDATVRILSCPDGIDASQAFLNARVHTAQKAVTS